MFLVCKQMLSVGFDFISHESHVKLLQNVLFHFSRERLSAGFFQ